MIGTDLRIDKTRQTGKTTRQMKEAPQNATFIWCNSRLHYPQKLAQFLGRSDLRIVSPSWLETDAWMALVTPVVITDHATRLSLRQWEAEMALRTYITWEKENVSDPLPKA